MNKMGLVGKKKCKDNVLRTVVREIDGSFLMVYTFGYERLKVS